MIKNLLVLSVLVMFSITALDASDTDDSHFARLKALCSDPLSPFKYDKQTNTYSIVWEVTKGNTKIVESYPLYFDPFTGEPLPSDKDFVYEADQALLKEITSKLSGVTSLEKVKAILGKPDYEFPAEDTIKGELLYKSLSATTEIIIQKQVQPDVVQVYAAGKPKK